jgi:hypothetical protein
LTIGPMSAIVHGLVVMLDLSHAKGLHQLLAGQLGGVPISASVDGLDLSFERQPVVLAGGLTHSKGADRSDMFSGNVAVALTQLSLAAFGQYQKMPAAGPDRPAYDVGWAEVHGIAAGFGLDSKLSEPQHVGQLAGYPLLDGIGKDFGQNMQDLQKNWISPSAGALWIAAGLKVRVCRTVDVRAVAKFSTGPGQKELSILAQASARLPRGSPPEKTLMLIELSLRGTLDLLHGELAIDGTIDPTSYILNHDCRPSGGFAVRSWFGDGNPHKGDVSFLSNNL